MACSQDSECGFCTVDQKVDVQEATVGEVGVSAFRRDLKDWLRRLEDGEEVVVTDRGRPVARLVGVDTVTQLDRLVADGVVSPPTGQRPRAVNGPRVALTGDGSEQPVSEAVVEDRDDHRT
ncbi:type II toxin-antitoxin system Phd/YefM family antitoxin [Salsipaludibacter albus]|uniref:type II toxin-antitoxin system Phd/YefM family antitoxin n=1 Tax=Salsipaludibacter albus TaxID=2849650 RepID=UPI001EE4599B